MLLKQRVNSRKRTAEVVQERDDSKEEQRVSVVVSAGRRDDSNGRAVERGKEMEGSNERIGERDQQGTSERGGRGSKCRGCVGDEGTSSRRGSGSGGLAKYSK
jgi:hypothetical protein